MCAREKAENLGFLCSSSYFLHSNFSLSANIRICLLSRNNFAYKRTRRTVSQQFSRSSSIGRVRQALEPASAGVCEWKMFFTSMETRHSTKESLKMALEVEGGAYPSRTTDWAPTHARIFIIQLRLYQISECLRQKPSDADSLYTAHE